MKSKLFFVVLALFLLLAGCSEGETAVAHNPPPQTQQSQDSAPVVWLQTPTLAPATPTATAGELTVQEAQEIALAHAGAAAQQVSRLHTERDMERGQPVYDVEFDWNGFEYSYEIHRQTGQILHWEKDRD